MNKLASKSKGKQTSLPAGSGSSAVGMDVEEPAGADQEDTGATLAPHEAAALEAALASEQAASCAGTGSTAIVAQARKIVAQCRERADRRAKSFLSARPWCVSVEEECSEPCFAAVGLGPW